MGRQTEKPCTTPACAEKRPRSMKAATAFHFLFAGPKASWANPRDIPDPTHGTDVLPTLISLCDLDESPDTDYDGVSLTGLLREREELEDRMIVVQYGHNVPTGNRTTRKGNAAVLWNRWRLVDDTELYHLDSDPAQEHNIADQHPDVVQKMRTHYDAWWDALGKNLDIYYPISIGTAGGKFHAIVQLRLDGHLLRQSQWRARMCDGQRYLATRSCTIREIRHHLAALAPRIESRNYSTSSHHGRR